MYDLSVNIAIIIVYASYIICKFKKISCFSLFC